MSLRLNLKGVKFGKLGMAGLMVFSGLGIATLFGNLPGVAPKAHAESWKFISSATLYPTWSYMTGESWGCKTLRNTPYGQVADVKIMFVLKGIPTYVPLGRVWGMRPGPNGTWTQIAYASSSSWWNGNSQILAVTISTQTNDWLRGDIESTRMFDNLSFWYLNNC